MIAENRFFTAIIPLFIEDKDTEGTTLQERTQRNYRPRMDRVISLAYARSKDGIHWEKPSLGLVDWRGSKKIIFCSDMRMEQGLCLMSRIRMPDVDLKW